MTALDEVRRASSQHSKSGVHAAKADHGEVHSLVVLHRPCVRVIWVTEVDVSASKPGHDAVGQVGQPAQRVRGCEPCETWELFAEVFSQHAVRKRSLRCRQFADKQVDARHSAIQTPVRHQIAGRDRPTPRDGNRLAKAHIHRSRRWRGSRLELEPSFFVDPRPCVHAGLWYCRNVCDTYCVDRSELGGRRIVTTAQADRRRRASRRSRHDGNRVNEAIHHGAAAVAVDETQVADCICSRDCDKILCGVDQHRQVTALNAVDVSLRYYHPC